MTNLSRLCALILALSISAVCKADDAIHFDIASQPLSAALKSFAQQSKMQILYRQDVVEGTTANAVVGSYDKHNALQQLLKGTGLEVVFSADNAATIRTKTDVSATTEGVGAEEPMTFRLAQNSTPTPASSAGDAEQGSGRVEEIVVTAQKRVERLKDVPISISVLSGEQLDHSSVEGITEALKRVPGVAANPHSQGGGTFISVRGVTASGPVLAGSSPVAYYLDSVPFGLVQSAFAPDANAYDMERVEVLRGPQGTLYGASAQAGVVRVLTKDADLEKFELKARALTSSTDGGSSNYRADAAINLPIVQDKLAARAIVGYEDLSGWIDTPFKQNSNDAKLKNARLKINAKPTDALSIAAFGWFSRGDYGGPSASTDQQKRISFIDESIAMDYDVYGLRLTYDLPKFSVTAVSGYIDYASGGDLDLNELTGSALPFFTGFDSRVFSEEVTLSSNQNGPWRWTVGAMYRDGSDTTTQLLPIFGIHLDWTNTSESAAIYGEISRRFFGDKLEWTLGGRYFSDKVVTQEDNGAPPANPPLYYRESKTFDSTTPRAVLTWYPNKDLTVYGSYSEGFRSGTPQPYYITGGVHGFPAVKPDKLHNYEMGAKGDLLGGRLQLDTALYYIHMTDVQQQLVVPFTFGNTCPSGCGVNAIINGEAASGIGVDFGLRVRPVDKLELGLNLNWNNLRMDADIYSAGVRLFAKGDRPNFSPEYTAGVSADYSFPLGGGGFEGKLSASANYMDKQGFRTIYPGVLSLGFGDSLLTARTSFAIQSPSRWQLTVFADNVTNEGGAVYGDPFSGPDEDARIRPRTIGMQIDYRY